MLFRSQKPTAGHISFFFQHSSLFLINISTRHSFLKHRRAFVKNQRIRPGRLCRITDSLFEISWSTLRPPVSTPDFYRLQPKNAPTERTYIINITPRTYIINITPQPLLLAVTGIKNSFPRRFRPLVCCFFSHFRS